MPIVHFILDQSGLEAIDSGPLIGENFDLRNTKKNGIQRPR
jgi:hypothetical protein